MTAFLGTLPGPDKLPAVSHWREHSFDGTQEAASWLVRRMSEGSYGFMKGAMHILWFRDEGARDLFMTEFGGTKMTLVKNGAKTETGEDAVRTLRKAGM